MTRYIVISENGPIADFKAAEWRKWIHCQEDEKELLPVMAVRKHIRERGGLGGKAMTFHVYIRATLSFPCVVNFYELMAEPQSEETR